ESLLEGEVEISDDMFIVRAEDAQRLKEPPRLAQLFVRPEHSTVQPGNQVALTPSAIDQYGQAFQLPTVSWSATGGTISVDGVYTVGTTAGLHTVRAQTGDKEVIAEVRIQTEKAPSESSGAGPAQIPGNRLIRWKGTVPPQKWMNFYAKVLTRFA